MEKNILKQIFFDNNHNWEAFKQKYGERIRPIVMDRIQSFDAKMTI